MFIVGAPNLMLRTDHKPLVVLLNSKPISELTSRLQKLRMRLLRFDYTIKYILGKALQTVDIQSAVVTKGIRTGYFARRNRMPCTRSDCSRHRPVRMNAKRPRPRFDSQSGHSVHTSKTDGLNILKISQRN